MDPQAMSGESDPDLDDLLGAAEAEPSKPTPFAERVAATLTTALFELRKSGMIEVEDAQLTPLSNEIIEAVLESSSIRKLPLRIVKTLIHSDNVEEVYGTDAEITAALQPFLEQI